MDGSLLDSTTIDYVRVNVKHGWYIVLNFVQTTHQPCFLNPARLSLFRACTMT